MGDPTWGCPPTRKQREAAMHDLDRAPQGATEPEPLPTFSVCLTNGTDIDQPAAEAIVGPSGALLLLGNEGEIWCAWRAGVWESVTMVATNE